MDIKTSDGALPDELTLTAIAAEVVRARTKFPSNAVLLAALMEEVGELANALLEHRFAVIAGKKPAELDDFRAEIQKEAIQVAAVAVRILEDGDSSFPYMGAREKLGRASPGAQHG